MTTSAPKPPKMSSEERAIIKARLAEIEEANGGVLTPDAVVADAKRKDSPLHSQFEWDTKKAAQAYWVIQARQLITSIRVEVRTETKVVSSVYYVRDPNAESDKQGYVSVKTLKTDEEMARDALIQAFSRVADLLRSARDLAAVLEVEDRVDKLVDDIVIFRRDIRGGEASPPQ